MAPASSCLQCNFSVNTDTGVFLTEPRIRLLESIEACGSISSAARALGMSYKWAWDEVNTLNHKAPVAMVACNTGGRRGGGAALTPYGVRIVAFYRALAREYQQTVDELSGYVTAEGEVNFRYLLRRRAMASGLRGLGHVSGRTPDHV